MNSKQQQAEYKQIRISINRAIDKYIKSRIEKIPTFVNQYFSFKGALKLHKKALSSDLYKGPINISWSLLYTVLKAFSFMLRKSGVKKIPSHIDKLPPGFETYVQKEVNYLIFTELLEIPYAQGKRKSDKDALFEQILNQPEISEIFVKHLSQIKEKSKDSKFRSLLEKNLKEYAGSRTAAADLAGSIITLSVGAVMFQKMTPGALATGSAVATVIAQQAAISSFLLGSTLGSLYYTVFPVSASMGLVVASIGSIMAALSIVTSFAGIITDPVQAKLGIHRKRLIKFIKCVETELKGAGETKYEIKDRYVARVFDLLDLIKTAASTAR